MFIKTRLIFLQIAIIQIFTKIQVLTIPADTVESQLINLREGQRSLSDELHEGLMLISERMESNIERIKDVLQKLVNKTTTITTTQKPNTEPRSCKEWLQDTGRSGTYLIKPSATSNLTFKTYCLIRKDRIGIEEEETSFWTVILRRKDGSVDFNRNWKDYQRGFGNIDGEFILGLDYIHELTRSAQQQLLIVLVLHNGREGYAKYNNFRVGNSTEGYVLKSLGGFSGNIYNAVKYSVNSKWSTKDVKNDKYIKSCANLYGGGWWYNRCEECVLTGLYNEPPKGKLANRWTTFSGYGEIKYALMIIRQFY